MRSPIRTCPCLRLAAALWLIPVAASAQAERQPPLLDAWADRFVNAIHAYYTAVAAEDMDAIAELCFAPDDPGREQGLRAWKAVFDSCDTALKTVEVREVVVSPGPESAYALARVEGEIRSKDGTQTLAKDQGYVIVGALRDSKWKIVRVIRKSDLDIALRFEEADRAADSLVAAYDEPPAAWGAPPVPPPWMPGAPSPATWAPPPRAATPAAAPASAPIPLERAYEEYLAAYDELIAQIAATPVQAPDSLRQARQAYVSANAEYERNRMPASYDARTAAYNRLVQLAVTEPIQAPETLRSVQQRFFEAKARYDEAMGRPAVPAPTFERPSPEPPRGASEKERLYDEYTRQYERLMQLMREGKGASLEAQQAYNEYLRAKTAYDALSR